MKKISYILVLLITLVACKSKKEVAEAVEVKVPIWVSSRPNNGFKYIGVGVAEKGKGGNYQMDAKKNALYDLSSEIKVNISSNSVLYTVQNNNNFNENFNSLINLSNTDNIEGYQLVDSYENEKQYWIYYQLDKQEYANQKAQKKQQIISKASNLISLSFNDENNKDFSSCLKKRIQAFGVLTPYLSEEIVFDSKLTNGIKTVFDLTAVIQQQLQSITLVAKKEMPILKPYQQTYAPLIYSLELKSKTPLQNFPFVVTSDEEKIKVNEKTTTNSNGELQVKVNYVEPINQTAAFALSPDISSLMGSDSLGRAGITVLKQFIQTPSLKVQARVNNITIFVTATEKNLGKPTGLNLVEAIIGQKFNGQEVQIVSKPDEADYIIESIAETKEDISSDILDANYKIKLAALVISLQLKNNVTKEVIYKTQVSEVYGYANSLEKAGMNAYSNPKLNTKLSEALFFLKRKILVY
ncbi:MAG: LPP20 family lipoprotein [Bacteroidota bacterium]|nr:LPP20 family lipoprotein [Bacteroidota bacterium]MDP3143972.1 LPP20 family lipoprotein [Bacteroidota bacterium]